MGERAVDWRYLWLVPFAVVSVLWIQPAVWGSVPTWGTAARCCAAFFVLAGRGSARTFAWGVFLTLQFTTA